MKQVLKQVLGEKSFKLCYPLKSFNQYILDFFQMGFFKANKLLLQLGLATMISSSSVGAWYNVSVLEACDPVQKWDVAEEEKMEQVNFNR